MPLATGFRRTGAAWDDVVCNEGKADAACPFVTHGVLRAKGAKITLQAGS